MIHERNRSGTHTSNKTKLYQLNSLSNLQPQNIYKKVALMPLVGS